MKGNIIKFTGVIIDNNKGILYEDEYDIVKKKFQEIKNNLLKEYPQDVIFGDKTIIVFTNKNSKDKKKTIKNVIYLRFTNEEEIIQLFKNAKIDIVL